MSDATHTILCIDDDEDVLMVLKAILESAGYNYVEATSAEDGLKAYQEHKPNLVIVDLMMEEVDAGTNFVKEIRAKGNQAPIFMLSSVGDNLNMMTDYTDLGLSGVFQKPVNKDRLLSVIASKLGE
jgi:CheY-like chemotaxis protein